MAPVVMALSNYPLMFDSKVCVTAQHRGMLDAVLDLFNIKPDYDLDLMRPDQNLWDLTASVLVKMRGVFEDCKPDVVLVHGDTTTALAASLSAFYAKIPVGHVEAGLRTFNKDYPFPEEINRVVADSISSFHFAPTQKAVDNLKKSGIDDKHIHLTGNTVIDALLYTIENHKSSQLYLNKNGFQTEESLKKLRKVKSLKTESQIHSQPVININPELKTILLTSHRRENFGEPLEAICRAVKTLVNNNSDIEVVYPVHPNPNVRNTVYKLLDGIDRIKLIEPLEYAPFAALMKASHIILTDSGGVQEEAPSLGKPVLVLRNETERPEAIECGTVKLVGTDFDKIVNTTQELLDSEEEYKKMAAAVNPYGDGKASERIVRAIAAYFETPQLDDIC